MKIRKNESINLRRAKRLREDSLDDVGTFRITMKDAETKYADVPFKVKGAEGEIDQIIYGDEFGDYFDENEIFTIASQPGKMHQLVRRAYMATNESINLRRAKKLVENNGYIVTKKGLKESDNDDKDRLETIYYVMNLIDNAYSAVTDASFGINKILNKENYPDIDIPFDVYLSKDERNALSDICRRLDNISDDIEDWFGYDMF